MKTSKMQHVETESKTKNRETITETGELKRDRVKGRKIEHVLSDML